MEGSIRLKVLMGCALLLSLPVTGRAVWEDVGGVVSDAAYHAQMPAIADVASGTLTPYVIFSQYNGANLMLVGRNFSTSWLPMGGALNITATADAPASDLDVDIAGYPHALWIENPPMARIWLKRYVLGVWQPMGGLATAYGYPTLMPRLAIFGSLPYATWTESNGVATQIVVAHYNLGWMVDAPSLNFNLNRNASASDIQMTASGFPVVAWCEETAGLGTQVYVKRFNGTGWELLGGSLNNNALNNAGHPRLAVWNETPYVVWEEHNGSNRQVFIKYYDGNWQVMGPALNTGDTQDAFAPDVALLPSGNPVVAWCEFDGNTIQVYAKQHVTLTTWIPLDISLNVDVFRGSANPDIAVIGDTPYVAWEENDGTSKHVIYCRRWRTPTPTPTITPTCTVSPTPGIPTATFTPTVSPTPQATFTPTTTATLSATRTISATFTLTRTATLSPTVSLTLTPSLTATISPTRTASLTFTPTRTATVPVAETPTSTPAGTTVTAHTATPTTTPTSRLVSPSGASPVIIRGNVFKPTSQPPLPIAVYLDEPQQVKIRIFTLRGKLVKTVADQMASAGTFEAVWNGANREGRIVRSGVYIVYVETSRFKERRKLVVVR
ncbi:MAG: FlgD immunoglobulin-like domain containing protein [candidate division FCPU426 bacterium]